jgi:hypothetical protein
MRVRVKKVGQCCPFLDIVYIFSVTVIVYCPLAGCTHSLKSRFGLHGKPGFV